MPTPNSPARHPYPFVTHPILKPKVWGGRRLAKLGKHLPPDTAPDALVGESWEVADLSTTSASGGGGDAAHSVVASGARRGATIRDLVRDWGADLLGPAAPTADGGFPLLVKFLDAREHLSVQVHPSPAYAAMHPEAHLKTESWYIVDAEPGSVLYKGLKPGVDEAQLRARIAEGTVADALDAVSAIPGECHTLPSGTLHALGAGVLVAEIQTPSDTTFRVYDWTREYNRPLRALHLDEAMRCIDFAPAPGPWKAAPANALVAQTDFYRVAEIRGHCEEKPLAGAALKDLAPAGHALVVMILGGMGAGIVGPRIHAEHMGDLMLRAGDTLVIPAACAEGASLRCGPMTRALVARVG
jgi:mannose-6-phosphate isomerase